MKCVVPISGGIDSTVLLHHAVKCGEYSDGVYAISFNYGQRHSKELEYAKRTVQQLNVPHKVIDLNFFRQVIDSSSLTNPNIKVAKTRDVLGDAQTVNYVPFRNQMLLSICCAVAESVKADTVFLGAAQIDTQSGSWDGRTEFLSSITTLTALNRQPRV
ncbi:7-cyano-7-deazaguanine synthase, partial [bacterium]|nr:7-cyano-7-deazaguanine synthase [bacterium]